MSMKVQPTPDERTTKELIEALADDVDRCHRLLVAKIDQGNIDNEGNVDADYEFAARQLLRAIFAFIEGVSFSVKVRAASLCLENGIDISDAERFFAVDVEHVLNDKGEVVERPARLRLADNVRFALSLLARAEGSPDGFDASVEWWSHLRAAIKVRHRLTHPRMPADTDISGDEIVTALKAYHGFSNHLLGRKS